MKQIWILFLKEIRSIFYSPIAYVVGAIFSLLNGYIFWIIMNKVNGPVGEVDSTVVELFFGGTLFGLLIVIPMITMRIFSEEKKSGTIELLFTAPLTDLQIVLGKFLAPFVFYLLLWLPTFFYILFISFYSPIDFNLVLTAYTGVILSGAMMISCGLIFSSITKNQIIAAVLTFAVLAGMFFIEFMNAFPLSSLFKKILDYISLLDHFSDFSKGLIDLKRIVYYCSLIIFNLFITIQIIGARKKI